MQLFTCNDPVRIGRKLHLQCPGLQLPSLRQAPRRICQRVTINTIEERSFLCRKHLQLPLFSLLLREENLVTITGSPGSLIFGLGHRVAKSWGRNVLLSRSRQVADRLRGSPPLSIFSSLCPLVTPSPCHPFTSSPFHPFTLSPCPSISLSSRPPLHLTITTRSDTIPESMV
jgi:hypothetical protein